MKKILILIITGMVAIVWYGIFSYMKPTTTERSTQLNNLTLEQDIAYDIIKIADWLEVPRSIVWTSQDRILITERPWRIRVIENNILQTDPIHIIPFISNRSEEGLMGITKDPDYDNNKYIYTAYAYTDGESMRVRIVRFSDLWDSLIDETLIIDKLPAAQRHAGTALSFWPDNKLYVTVGDATQGEKAQFPDYYNGKIIRLNSDGSVPEDNPYPWYATRSMGHRNSQGIARNSQWIMYAIDHGPSIFDGPPGWDEINLISKGSNHGRPIVSHEKTQTGMDNPIAIFTPALAPASLMIYNGSMFPEWKDNLFVGGLRGQTILKVAIDPNMPDNIIDQQKIIDDSYGRIRFIWQAPDGSIYFSTSNQDGRWKKSPNGDSIYQIIRR